MIENVWPKNRGHWAVVLGRRFFGLESAGRGPAAGGNLTPDLGSWSVVFRRVPSNIGSKIVENLPKIVIFSARPTGCGGDGKDHVFDK